MQRFAVILIFFLATLVLTTRQAASQECVGASKVVEAVQKQAENNDFKYRLYLYVMGEQSPMIKTLVIGLGSKLPGMAILYGFDASGCLVPNQFGEPFTRIKLTPAIIADIKGSKLIDSNTDADLFILAGYAI